MNSHAGELGSPSRQSRIAAYSFLLVIPVAGCASSEPGTGSEINPQGYGTGAVWGVDGAAANAGNGSSAGGGGLIGQGGVIGNGSPLGNGGSIGQGGFFGQGGALGNGGSIGQGGFFGQGGVIGNGGSVGGGGPIPHGACLDGITNYGQDGPFTVKPQTMGAVHFTVPNVPPGCKVPVVHMANGTGATCSNYQPALNRLATHGFLAACYENTNTGAGSQGLQALDMALSTFPDLADNKFGSTGHSQGGQAAFTVMALAEKKYGDTMIYAGLAMEPASGFGTQPTGGTWQQVYAGLKSPMFMFSGLGTDGLVSQAWVQQAYDATSKTEEAYFWTANGATHIPVPNGEEEEISIPWFRWKLLGDQQACAFFKAIPTTNKKWVQVASKNAQPCQ